MGKMSDAHKLISFKDLREIKQQHGYTDITDYQQQINLSEIFNSKYNRIRELDLTKTYKYWQLLEYAFSYFFVDNKDIEINQIFNIFRTKLKDNKLQTCIVGLTNELIYNTIEHIKKEEVEQVYEDVLFNTNIIECPYCDAFDLTKFRNNKEDNTETIIYDKQTKKLINLLTHLNDIHEMKFTKILNIVKKYNY